MSVLNKICHRLKCTFRILQGKLPKTLSLTLEDVKSHDQYELCMLGSACHMTLKLETWRKLT